MGSFEDVESVCNLIKSRIDFAPTIGIICGSGLGTLGEAVENKVIIAYEEIKEFPLSTVVGHAGNLLFGKLGGKYVMVMQGRFHPYEGYALDKVTLPIRVMSRLGIKTLFVTNAAGSVNENYNIGDMMIIKDHINVPALAGKNPLVGPNDDRFGTRFPDLCGVYTKELRDLAKKMAKEMKIEHFVREGVYLASSGPAYETPAELQMFRRNGADVIGMSTANETMIARHAGLNVFGMTLVTNVCNMDVDSAPSTNHEEVLATGKLRGNLMRELVTKMIQAM